MIARQYRIRSRFHALLSVVVLVAAPAARAHHSASAFDSAEIVSVEGVVTRYEWANPHVYVWLATPGANGETVEWEVEGQPPAVMRRVGWSRETLNVGDTVRATGNPARNAQPKKLLLLSMKRADTELYDGQRLLSALTASGAAPAAAADGIAGVWVTLLDIDTMRSYLDPAGRVSLTQAGAAAQAAFDEATMNPGLQCIPSPAPAFMFAPDVKRITLEGGLIRIAGEFAAAERVIRLPDEARRDPTNELTSSSAPLHGHSVGRWEGATLVIETTHFAPHATGLGFTLPSSPNKRLVERLTPDENGRALTYAFELSDADMLTASITGTSRWIYRPDIDFAAVACDLENARRFVQ